MHVMVIGWAIGNKSFGSTVREKRKSVSRIAGSFGGKSGQSAIEDRNPCISRRVRD